MSINNKTISVCMITYNQESYLAEAIYGVLNQKCNYAIELLVADDCSTDNTSDLVNNIINNHPNGSWIKYIKQESNLGLMANLISILKQCNGEYIAICEGDDYWTDPNKLQFQVDFLEKNQDFILCGHNVKVYLQNKGRFVNDSVYSFFDKKVDINKLAFGNFIHSPSVVFRNIDFDDYYKYFAKSPNWDYPMYMMLAQFGRIMKFKSKKAVYRVHDTSVWSSLNNINRLSKWLDVLNLLVLYFKEKKDLKVVKILENQEINVIRTILFAKKLDNCNDDEYMKKINLLSEKFPRLFVNYFNYLESNVIQKNKYFGILFNSFLVRRLQKV